MNNVNFISDANHLTPGSVLFLKDKSTSMSTLIDFKRDLEMDSLSLLELVGKLELSTGKFMADIALERIQTTQDLANYFEIPVEHIFFLLNEQCSQN